MITLELPERHPVENAVVQCLPALRGFLVRARRAVPLDGVVSVVLTSDRALRKLNREFRHLDHATDVLSFPAAPLPGNMPITEKRASVSGDLAISVDAAARQAERFGHPLQSELKILLLHGLLHLAGYDHEADDGEMDAAEEQLRRRFRLPALLIARTLRPASRRASAVRV